MYLQYPNFRSSLAVAGELVKSGSPPSIEVRLHVFLCERDSRWAATDNTANTASVRLSIGCNLEVVPEDISTRLHLCYPIHGATNVSVGYVTVLIRT
jgi:hypothetical protein